MRRTKNTEAITHLWFTSGEWRPFPALLRAHGLVLTRDGRGHVVSHERSGLLVAVWPLYARAVDGMEALVEWLDFSRPAEELRALLDGGLREPVRLVAIGSGCVFVASWPEATEGGAA